jgi:hypothetical protein
MPLKTARIPLGRNGLYEAIVDADDYAFLTQWRWSYKTSSWAYGAKVYAKRTERRDGKQVSVYMATVVLTERKGEPRPSPLHTVDHQNVDSLDNTRGNLRWATKSEQNSNQRKRIRKDDRARMDAISVVEEVPF